MYIAYVDESGDTGLLNSPSKYFILSALVIHELRWKSAFDSVINFRRNLRTRYGFKVREEIHAAQMIRGNGILANIHKSQRLQILKEVVTFQAGCPDFDIVNIVVDKVGKPPTYDVFDNAWSTLIQRIHNTIQNRNFKNSVNQTDKGIIVADDTDAAKLRKLQRRMMVFNYVPNTGGVGSRPIPTNCIIKDPIHRNSADSYFIQLADVNAYFLTQKLSPNAYVKRKGAKNYFDKLNPNLCKVASRRNAQGIVML